MAYMHAIRIIFWVAPLLLVTKSRTITSGGLRFANEIRNIADKAVGLKQIQDKYDRFGKYKASVIDWPTIVDEISREAGMTFGDITDAIRKLKKRVEISYDSDPVRHDIKRCCRLSKETLRYDRAFRTDIVTKVTCERRAEDGPEPLRLPHESFRNEASNNLAAHQILKWQYMGTETGGTIIYPGFLPPDCNYDPRLRPWYVETFAPEPKDIVIVLDAAANGQRPLLKEAVLTIIRTSNPNDRIGIVKFGNSARTPPGSEINSTCYSNELALATPQNKNYLKSFVEQEESSGKSEAAKYTGAIEKAFSIFSRDNDKTRRRVLLFFAQNDPHDPVPRNIPKKLKQENDKLENKAIVLTYAFEDDIKKETKEILETMATQTHVLTINGNKTGQFTNLNNSRSIRLALSSYYDTLSEPLDEPRFVLPYIDHWGLGLVISVCLPFYSPPSKFRGVTCIDIVVAEVLRGITNIPGGEDTYSFIIDLQGHTIMHPFLPTPSDVKDDNYFIDISLLERQGRTQEVIDRMKRANSNQTSEGLSFRVSRPKVKVNFPGQWIENKQVVLLYQWARVPHSSYSMCIVSTSGDVEIEVTRGPEFTGIHYLNPVEIEDNFPCSHRGYIATTAKSTVRLTATAFSDQSCYNLKADDFENAITRYFRSVGDFKCIKNGVKEAALLSGIVDDIWKRGESKNYNRVVYWRHIATTRGTIRTFPGVNIEIDLDVTEWYVKALTYAGKIIIARQDSTLTLSHVIYEGKSNKHSPRDAPVAVVAAELDPYYLNNLLNKSFSMCNDRNYSCFVVDNSGEILLHPDLDGSDQRRPHILSMEPAISNYLLTKNLLVNGSCINFVQIRKEIHWEIVIPGGFVGNMNGNPPFEMYVVYGTNAFLVIKKLNPEQNRNAKSENRCPECTLSEDLQKCHQNVLDEVQCRCPCYLHIQFNLCNYTLPSSLREIKTCPLRILPTPPKIRMTTENHNLRRCVPACANAKTERDCSTQIGCTWCEAANGEKCSMKYSCPVPANINSNNLIAIIVPIIILAILIAVLIFWLVRKYSPGTCNRKVNTQSAPKAHSIDIVPTVSPVLVNTPDGISAVGENNRVTGEAETDELTRDPEENPYERITFREKKKNPPPPIPTGDLSPPQKVISRNAEERSEAGASNTQEGFLNKSPTEPPSNPSVTIDGVTAAGSEASNAVPSERHVPIRPVLPDRISNKPTVSIPPLPSPLPMSEPVSVPLPSPNIRTAAPPPLPKAHTLKPEMGKTGPSDLPKASSDSGISSTSNSVYQNIQPSTPVSESLSLSLSLLNQESRTDGDGAISPEYRSSSSTSPSVSSQTKPMAIDTNPTTTV